MKYLSSLFMVSFAALFTVSCGTESVAPDALRTDPAVAMQYMSDFFNLGPKPYRSKELQNASEWIQKHAKEYTALVRETDCGRPEESIRNVEAVFPGRDEKHFVIIGTHFDTKRIFSYPDFAGANDSASGVGAQLAMMRTLSKISKEQLPCSIRFYFFDGEECLYNYSDTDGLHGSRACVSMLKQSGEDKNCLGMILLDMIGDKELVITPPLNGDAKLIDAAVKSAAQLGHPERVKPYDGMILDDHLPFYQAHIPCIDLIDFSYGPNNAYWHTSADTPDKLSAESIAFSADLAFRLYLYLAEKGGTAR